MHPYLLLAMAFILTEDQKTAAYEAGTSEFKQLLNKEGVDYDLQVQLMHNGVVNSRLYSVLAKDDEEFKKMLKDHFGVDAEADFRARVKMSKALLAWNLAKTRVTESAKVDGILEAKGLPKELSVPDGNLMRAAFEEKWWELEDEQVPGKQYLERKLNELEQGVMKAELLVDVLKHTEDEPEDLKANWKGTELTMVKVCPKAPLPRNPEELRERINLMGTAWMMIAFQQTHRKFLQGITPQVFQEYLSYLLGKHVLGLTAKTELGVDFNAPSWGLVISYEHSIRSKCMQLIRKKNLSFKDALKEAWEDPVTRDRNFTTPLALEPKRKPYSEAVPPPPRAYSQGSQNGQPPKRQRRAENKGGKSKGKGGKSKGKGKGGSLECKSTTPGGEPICFRYNAGGCSAKDCRFVHKCGKCFGDHPIGECRA